MSAAMTDSHEMKVRDRAYELWESEGCPDGCAERHWLQAERELDHGLEVANGPSPRRKSGKRMSPPPGFPNTDV